MSTPYPPDRGPEAAPHGDESGAVGPRDGEAGGVVEPEAIHLPRPSLWPVTLALGVTLLAAGPLLGALPLSLAGVLLGAYAIAAWVAEMRHEATDAPHAQAGEVVVHE